MKMFGKPNYTHFVLPRAYATSGERLIIYYNL